VIPYGRQDITQADIDAVIDVLKSDFLTQGPAVPQFEEAVSKKVHAKYAVAVNSATSALHIACLALGLKQGDWLWTSPITFVASANCALYCGAQVDFVDINPQTYNLCPQELERKLIAAEKEGRLPKIVIPVHLAGQSCDMQAIHALSKKYNFKIIEDASHAIGGKYQNQYIGGCQYSDITVFSFHPVKIITTGEGGMAVTNDEGLAFKMRLLRSHGITRDASEMTRVPDGPWYYEQIDLGFNYRMTDIQAALGLSQLRRLDQYVQRRNELALFYKENLAEFSAAYQKEQDGAYSAYHLFIMQVQDSDNGKIKLDIYQSCLDRGIGVNFHYIPVYRHPFYSMKKGINVNLFVESEKYYRSAFTIPLYPNISLESAQFVINTIKEIIQK
jgi:UDP-4-amino-4,6-dideoxy-N-acetyl-beta-L-altrosamine transaminase